MRLSLLGSLKTKTLCFFPQVLSCPNRCSCVTFSPTKASAVFAGLDDGTVCAWDLREGTAKHKEVARENKEEEEQEWIFRYN